MKQKPNIVSANAVSNVHPFPEYTIMYVTYLKNFVVFIAVYRSFSFSFSKILFKRKGEAATKKLRCMDFFMPADFKHFYIFYHISFIVRLSAMPVIYVQFFAYDLHRYQPNAFSLYSARYLTVSWHA